MANTISLMTEEEFFDILDTFNYLEGCPKSKDEITQDAKDIYNCYNHSFRNHQITLDLFKRIVWDVFEYYEEEPLCKEYQIAKKFIKESYLYM